MLKLNIPGRGELTIKNVVFDYNGTIALDGFLEEEIKAKLQRFSNSLDVYILTADTYGTVKKECSELNLEVKTFPQENAGLEKQKILKKLGGEVSITVGNGFNDIEMFKESVLSFAVMGEEGCCGKLIMHADIVFKSIYDVFGALNNPDRIKATLRN